MRYILLLSALALGACVNFTAPRECSAPEPAGTVTNQFTGATDTVYIQRCEPQLSCNPYTEICIH